LRKYDAYLIDKGHRRETLFLYSWVSRLINLIRDKKRDNYLNVLIKRGLKLGKGVDIIDTFFFDPSHCFLISIGDNCTICPGVRLIAHDASTKKMLGYTKIGKICIKENCFIGDSALVLPGVTIGPDSIVGAGSVVVKDVPPGTIVAGNPAHVIMQMADYAEKIEAVRKNKKVFDSSYFIENLDAKKEREIVESIGDSIGFIL
jgi:maltose O-acetyltransferase